MIKLPFTLLLATTALPAASQQPAPVAAPAPSAADQRLKALYDGYAEWSAKEFGYFENAKGESEQAGYLPKVDPASQLRRAAHLQGLLAQLDAIPAAQLSAAERVNAGVLRTILEAAISDAKFREWEMPANSDSNFWTYHDERNPLSDAGAYRRYISRMLDLPRFFDEQIANMRAGLARGFTPPQVTLVGREGSIASFIKTETQDSSFYAPFKQMPSNISAAEAAKLQAEGRAAIAEAVTPAYRKLLDFWVATYVPGARQSVSARDL